MNQRTRRAAGWQTAQAITAVNNETANMIDRARRAVTGVTKVTGESMTSNDDIPEDTPYAIGSDKWPGLSKLTEECGEVLQLIGKLLAYPTPGEAHPDGQGPILDRLPDELGDLLAAIEYFAGANGMADAILSRATGKVELFWAWHQNARDASVGRGYGD